MVVSADMAGLVKDAKALARFELGALPEATDTHGQNKDNPVALILYTSGTTGKPKGALISHDNLTSLAALLGKAWDFSSRDRLLHCLPLHHLHGLGISLLVAVLNGASVRMLPRFDAFRLWEEMKDASVFMGVPTMHKLLLDAFDKAPESDRRRFQAHAASLRLITSGSAALPRTVSGRLRQLSGNVPLERFGMTEIGVGASNPYNGERRAGSCGPPLPGMHLRIVNEQGEDVALGEAGEIWIQGPTVFLGYDDNPEATTRAFAKDGWFRSGDTATWQDDKYIKILGRTSVDILKSGGYKLSALEIEETLRDHAAVKEVAVVGIPDETWGEIAVAAVISQGACDESGLRSWAKDRIASYKVPKRVLFLEEFPRNPVGKVVKPELAKMLKTRL